MWGDTCLPLVGGDPGKGRCGARGRRPRVNISAKPSLFYRPADLISGVCCVGNGISDADRLKRHVGSSGLAKHRWLPCIYIPSYYIVACALTDELRLRDGPLGVKAAG